MLSLLAKGGSIWGGAAFVCTVGAIAQANAGSTQSCHRRCWQVNKFACCCLVPLPSAMLVVAPDPATPALFPTLRCRAQGAVRLQPP